MQKLYYNANIHTLDNSCPIASAMAVINGKIAAVGTKEEAAAALENGYEAIDLGGRTVIPGLTDTHMHALHYATSKKRVDLSSANSAEKLVEILRNAFEKGSLQNGWLVGISFDQNAWPVPELPTRDILDKVTTEVPIAIYRACYHVACVNSRAVELLGLGDSDGVLRESEAEVLDPYLDSAPTYDEIRENVLEVCSDLLRHGFTCVHTDDFGDGSEYAPIYKAYRSLAEENKLPLKIVAQCRMMSVEAMQQFVDDGRYYGERHGRYRIGEHKLLLDGSLGARTAYMAKPYVDDPTTQGIPLFDQETLYNILKISHRAGFPITVHCIGDGALDMYLDVIERLQKEMPRKDARHAVNHCQISRLDQINRIRDLDMLVYSQPIFVRADQHVTELRVGEALGRTSYAWRSLIEAGVHVSGGSDCPVEPFDSMPNIAMAVTRTDTSRPDAKPWHPEQCLSVEEAVRMFALEGAYATFEEHTRGSISVNKAADFAVLDRDIFTVDKSLIAATTVEMTVVDGEIAYQK